MVIHPFAPVWDERSRVLVLGTFPSVKSRENHFYYGNPQNRFWRVLALLFDVEIPKNISEKRELLLKNRIALWDVLESCEITGSSDASIRNSVPNDIAGLLEQTSISRVVCNGQKAAAMYKQYCEAACRLSATVLPSTSPANAAWSVERLAEEWRVLAR